MDRHLSLAPRAPRKLASCLMVLALPLGLLAGPAHGACEAKSAWLEPNAPEPPQRVEHDDNCDFHQWAVQEFLYQVQTVDGLARFLTLASPHALFLYPGDKPAPYPGSATTLFKLGAGMARLHSTRRANAAPLVFLPRTVKTSDSTFTSFEQAGSRGVLVDQAGQWVYYTSSINKVYYDFVVDKKYYLLGDFKQAKPGTTFPVGTLETKSAWRIAAVKGEKPYIPDTSDFYTIEAQVCKDAKCTSLVPAKMALVGLHLVGRIKDHPEMIWATFEHRFNAPDCDVAGNRDFRDHSFYKNGTNCGNAPFWSACNKAGNGVSEICRVHPQGEPGAPAVNTDNILDLNDSFHKLLSKRNPTSVWMYYDYEGAVWTNGGKVNEHTGLIVLDDAAIRGSKKAANTSLESFTQEQNCLHCHTYQPLQIGDCFGERDEPKAWNNLYFSHLFGLLCKTGK